MAFKGERIAVGVAATVIAAAEGDGSSVLIKNIGAAAVDLGDAAVATGAGYALAANDIISVDIAPGEALYAVAASGSVNVAVLHGRYK